MAWLELPISVDEGDLVQEAFDYVVTVYPEWTPRESNLEVALIEEFASMAAETAETAAIVGREIFKKFGNDLVGLPPLLGARASAVATFIAADTLGYNIPNGTQVAYNLSGDDVRVFEVFGDYAILPGEATIDGVILQATEDGVAYNGLPAQEISMVDALLWVQSVETTTVSGGGTEPEDEDTYLGRLTEALSLMAPRPIIASDFAAISRSVPGVARAKALDNYDPRSNTYDNERMVTVVPVSADGRPVSAAVRQGLVNFLDARRELNFIVHVINPIYTPIHVVYTATCFPGEDPALVHQEAKNRVELIINPATFAGGAEDPPRWYGENVLHFYEIVGALEGTPGLDRITALTVNGISNQDIALFEPAGLPAPLGPNLIADSQVQGAVSPS